MTTTVADRHLGGSAARNYGIALASLGMASVARWLLDPVLGAHLPYVTYFVAVAVAAWLTRLWPSIFTLVIGWWLADFLWCPPRYDLIPSLHTALELVGAGTYFMVGAASIAVCESMRSQRRGAERAQHDAARLAAIVTSSDDAIISKNLEGVITSWNKGAERLFGYTAQEAVNQPVLMLIPPEYQDEEPRILQSIRRGESITHYETVRRRKDGTLIDISLSVSPIRDASGNIVGASKIARDITERKHAQETLRRAGEYAESIVKGSPFGLYVVDADFRICQMNEDAQNGAFINVRPVIGRRLDEAVRILWPEPVASEVIAIFRHTLETGEPYHSSDFVNPRADTQQVEGYEWELHRTTLPDGRKGVICYYFDSTSLRRAERRAREALLQAERNARMKDEFLATVSHELRTPMTAIVGWTQLLRAPDIQRRPEDFLEGIEIIDRNARLQTQIIDDLLDMSRIMAGKIHLNIQSVKLGEIVATAVESVRPAAIARGVRIQNTCDRNVSDIRGDAGRLQQVFYNLLTNAVKFTPRGGRIQVVCQRVNSHNEVSVSDTGVGIDAEFLPFVFERFRQQDGTMTRHHGGLGLGLAIVKQIVEMHGGTVQAASEGKDKGATFTVHLPVAIAIKPELPAGELERRHPLLTGDGALVQSIDTTAARGRKVLIVEDEADARTLLCRVLRERGIQCVEAPSGREALAMLKGGFHPDLIVSDLGMPGLNGYELMSEIRRLPPEQGGATPAIALTAFARAEDRTRSLLAGYQLHLSKPVELPEFLASVVSLLA